MSEERRESSLPQEAEAEASVLREMSERLSPAQVTQNLQVEHQLLHAPNEPDFMRSMSNTPVPRGRFDLEGLRQILALPRTMSAEDLEAVIAQVPIFMHQLVEISYNLAQQRQFQQWFTNTGYPTIIVHGYDQAHADFPISAMSTTVVSILGELSGVARARGQSPNIAYMQFFCGLHAAEEEGPRMIMKSLILQLAAILQMHGCLNLSFINSDVYVDDLRNANPEVLLNTILLLCCLLPPHLTVYCCIDGVNFYEDQRRHYHGEMIRLLETLVDIPTGPAVQHEDGSWRLRPNLKVLLTSASRSIFGQLIENRIGLHMINAARPQVDEAPGQPSGTPP